MSVLFQWHLANSFSLYLCFSIIPSLFPCLSYLYRLCRRCRFLWFFFLGNIFCLFVSLFCFWYRFCYVSNNRWETSNLCVLYCCYNKMQHNHTNVLFANWDSIYWWLYHILSTQQRTNKRDTKISLIESVTIRCR